MGRPKPGRLSIWTGFTGACWTVQSASYAECVLSRVQGQICGVQNVPRAQPEVCAELTVWIAEHAQHVWCAECRVRTD